MYAIARSYNAPRLRGLIKRLDSSDRFTAIVVVVDSDRDSTGTADSVSAMRTRTSIRTVLLENYGWSRALNAGIDALPRQQHENELVMMISNEVAITIPQIDALAEKASSKDASCSYVHFKGRSEPTYFVPRNTCAVWRRGVFERVGLFDERFDHKTGMEDYELVLRSYRDASLLPFLAARGVPLRLPETLNLAEKLDWESRGLLWINSLYSEHVVSAIEAHLASQFI